MLCTFIFNFRLYNERLPFVPAVALSFRWVIMLRVGGFLFFLFSFFCWFIKNCGRGLLFLHHQLPFLFMFSSLLLERLANHGFVFPIYMNRACFFFSLFLSCCLRRGVKTGFSFIKERVCGYKYCH